jgi:predicted DsbA family dithiol-disulfide isomerase
VIRVTFFTEVTSSWCFWAEPAWAELKERYAGRAEFQWKIALLDARALPSSKQQLEWFYRRSGTITCSSFMLNSGWYEHGLAEYLAPNVIAEAGKDFGVIDDRIRLALTHAALRDGRRINDWNTALEIAAKAGSIEIPKLKAAAQKPETEKRVRESTAEFHALKVTQRPTFVIENEIGDKAVLSGTWVAAPLAAVIDSMMADEAAYLSWATHMGKPPAQ